ncbi:MAG: response regulator transcription factor [Deltaproteobacteria bacterium]|nr:response regulator transcription factor [Candidatus Zymogenaceae bacterium]
MNRTKDSKKRTVLIVDDHDQFRNSLKELITSRFSSFRCEEAKSGKDAMLLVETVQPDLIFMDIKLPDNNGLELTRRIKKTHPEKIIIVITQHDIPEYKEASLESGADYFISKGSMDTDDIVRLIEHFVT